MDGALRDEVVGLARDLIRVDTTNPPGRETAAARVLEQYLTSNGVSCELVARDPDRANLIARIPGLGDGPSIALLGHTDVVYADPADWRGDPFSGDVLDGHLWGRGALDMKGHTACNAVTLALLARSGLRPRGDVLLIAEADEEDGAGDVGMSWLVHERPDLRTDYALNEGGGYRIVLADGRAVYYLAAAEKATMPVRVIVHGQSGHASIPTSGENALVKCAPVLERLAAHSAEIELVPEVAAMLDALVPGGSLDDRIDRARRLHPAIDHDLPAMMATTIAPTMATASSKRNVIPARAEITCDCRVLPGTTVETLLTEVRTVLEGLDVTVESIEPASGGTRSPLDTPLHRAIVAEIRQREPDALVVPSICVGFTDSHYVREAFGAVAYGFFPARYTQSELLETIHAADERVDVRDLVEAVEFNAAVVRRVAG